jgi:hypothetical protein
LEVIKQLHLSIHFERVADTQAVNRLADPKFASSRPEAFDTKKAVTTRLAFLDPGVATLIPSVPAFASRRIRGFLPAPTPFVRKLNHRNGTQSVGDFEPCILRVLAVFFILGEIVAARPSATRADGAR